MTKQLARTAATVVMTTAMAWNLPASAQTPAPSRPAATHTRSASAPAAPAAPASAPASAPKAARGSFGPNSGPASKSRP